MTTATTPTPVPDLPIIPASPFDPLQRAAVKIAAEDISWRIGNTWDRDNVKWGTLLGYIDARTCMDKLDALDPEWESDFEPHLNQGEGSCVVCRLTVGGKTRTDVGTPSDIEGPKGAFSDALKRAAVQFGIGRELYELPTIAVQCETRANGKAGKPLALPFLGADGRWQIDRNLGWIKYDDDAPAAPPTTHAAATAPDAPVATAPVRSAPVATPGPGAGSCPIHHKAFKSGTYGWYCPTPTGEGENGKKTWCQEKPAVGDAPSASATYEESPFTDPDVLPF